jgi:hypothetical protein
MLATHSSKIFNAKISQSAVRSRIIGSISKTLICSKNVRKKKEIWASPLNAAKIKEFMSSNSENTCDETFQKLLPAIEAINLKQLLIPLNNWRDGDYIAVSPTTSLGLINEVFNRLKEQNLPYLNWKIQPNRMSLPNHGETLVSQGGIVRMLRRGIRQTEKSNWQGDFVQLSARCEKMNISSGMVAVGLPAITAIGGAIHAIERKTGFDIDFAIGLRNVQWIFGVPKITTWNSGKDGRAISPNVLPSASYSKEEVCGNCHLVLLLKSDGDLNIIADALSSLHKIAGGSLFDTEVTVNINSKPAIASYLQDASNHIASILNLKQDKDVLDAALENYGLDGAWVDNKWTQLKNSHTLNHNGYAFLEKPNLRIGGRENYKHCWSEPVFTLLKQSSMNKKCFWRRQSSNSGVVWRGI